MPTPSPRSTPPPRGASPSVDGNPSGAQTAPHGLSTADLPPWLIPAAAGSAGTVGLLGVCLLLVCVLRCRAGRRTRFQSFNDDHVNAFSVPPPLQSATRTADIDVLGASPLQMVEMSGVPMGRAASSSSGPDAAAAGAGLEPSAKAEEEAWNRPLVLPVSP